MAEGEPQDALWDHCDLLQLLWLCFVVTSLPHPTTAVPIFSLLSKSLLGPDVAFANPELFFRAAVFAGDFVPVTFYRLLWDCCAWRGKAQDALAVT